MNGLSALGFERHAALWLRQRGIEVNVAFWSKGLSHKLVRAATKVASLDGHLQTLTKPARRRGKPLVAVGQAERLLLGCHALVELVDAEHRRTTRNWCSRDHPQSSKHATAHNAPDGCQAGGHGGCTGGPGRCTTGYAEDRRSCASDGSAAGRNRGTCGR